VKGKIGYIAPEQALAGDVDPRTDVFATGVVLWEALTGTRLFKGDTDAATLNQTMRGEIANPSSVRDEVPPELDAVVLRALSRQPEERYASARAMRQCLAPFAGQVDARSLSLLMSELFAEELFEQRRVVTTCMRESETAPPSASYRQPSSTSAIVIPSLSNAEPTSSVSKVVADMRKGQRVALRVGLVALGLGLGLSAVIVQRSVLPARASGAVQASTPTRPSLSPARVQPPSPALVHASQPPPATTALPKVAPAQLKADTPNVSRAVAPRASREHAGAAAAEARARDAASNLGLLTLDSTPWSIVSVDGKTLGQTPLVGIKLPVPAGVHQLTLKNPELAMQTTYTVTIEAGKTFSRRVGLEK
jgi:eukaryotic-like serine/threonine-protein kinase